MQKFRKTQRSNKNLLLDNYAIFIAKKNLLHKYMVPLFRFLDQIIHFGVAPIKTHLVR